VGWDAIRLERSTRQRQLGLQLGELSPPAPEIVPHWNLSERELQVQIDPAEVPRAVAWSSLNADQQRFQTAKMAVHAAMIERMDREIGRVLDTLRQLELLDNTLIFFASDNGASAELINRGDRHERSAPPGSGESFLCLGPGWSTAANTPFRLHKSWVHEGGIATPLIVSWPRRWPGRGEWRHAPGHFIDLVPTLLDLLQAPSEKSWNGQPVPALPGRSLVPALAQDVAIARDYLYFHHENNRALRIGDWKLVSKRPETNRYALFDLSRDRTEQIDLAEREPNRADAMARRWREIEDEFRRLAGPLTRERAPANAPANR
jgi:arylsulfatase